eukprot:361080-Prymnesium_polylepis.1
MSEVAAGAFGCALHAAAPSAHHLFDVAFEWSYQRKGRPLMHEEALTSLCAFEGAPCDLFLRPRVLLLRFATHLALTTRGAKPYALMVGAHSRALEGWLSSAGWR